MCNFWEWSGRKKGIGAIYLGHERLFFSVFYMLEIAQNLARKDPNSEPCHF